MCCPAEEQDEPKFLSINNSGNWGDYTLHPKFKGKGNNSTYTHHKIQAGTQTVPVDKDTGTRTENGFEFHYNGQGIS